MQTPSWRDVVRRDLFGPSPDPCDRPYRLVIRAFLVVLKLFGFRFDVRGSQHLPREGGAVIASNHVSYFDFTYLELAALPQRRLVRFMAKASVFDNRFAGPPMRAMQHIPVDRTAGVAAFDEAVRALKDGKVVGVFPEATISSSFTVQDLKAGAARMAVQAGVPVVPAALWGGHRVATKNRRVVLRRGVPVTVLLGAPVVPEPGEKAQSVLRRTRAAMEALLEEAQRSYPDSPAGDDDRWWLPAHLGGTAPTPEQARAIDLDDVRGTAVTVQRSPLQKVRHVFGSLVTRRRRGR
ncbi:lysophospholipid acyltransferase family protein [Klenkia brasiliensis]|uniref:1-acyl-sn-glycerol-3-phosphate acyltransferases n=1 Tax=Klenkia brasiliensis TaxID=333142 RepID=A0A1G7Z9K0_9ACTN|nr:lysophospholipid acyltransferase family protein [Klenkia brasiliensis]SDH05277.1 1-acyl-sn-glycerol-3-phosphate acyltransferases [Klenkia brasiliensis]